MEEKANEQQVLIDALNARTAAYDVELSELRQSVLDAQHALDVANETIQKLSQTIEENAKEAVATRWKALVEQKAENDREMQAIVNEANAKLTQLQNRAKAFEARWEAQNGYVIALEGQSVDAVRATLLAHRDAELRAQIETLQAKLQ